MFMKQMNHEKVKMVLQLKLNEIRVVDGKELNVQKCWFWQEVQKILGANFHCFYFIVLVFLDWL